MKIYKTNGELKYDLPNCNTPEECVKEILRCHNKDFSFIDFSFSNFRGSNFSFSNFKGSKSPILSKPSRLYIYITYSYKSLKGYRIRLGCFDKSLTEWVNDFWNNDIEFPNNGSERSNRRLYAFNVMRRVIRKHAFTNGELTDELKNLLEKNV